MMHLYVYFKVNIIIRYIIVLVTQKEIHFDVLNEDLYDNL